MDGMTGGPEAQWRAALAGGRFLLQRAISSGTVFFPPRVMEPGTGETDLEWVEATGLGHIYSLTWVSQKPPVPPYNVAIVRLDEGAQLMSRIEGADPETLHIGQRVRAKIGTQDDGAPILLFEPTGH
ncbi:MAG: Zn-ribbon domain-containing OB-fold protein [Sphingobium phenoxybenzoativorans]